MPRLPIPGQDSGTWGDILNDYLSQTHKPDGSLKDDSVGAAQIADSAVTSSAIAPNSVTNAAIASDAVNATSIADGSITEGLLHAAVQTKLNTKGPVVSTDISDSSALGRAVLVAGESAEARDALQTDITTFYDDFTTKPDGALNAGAVSDSGHTYTVLGQIPWQIVGGRLTHTQTNSSTAQSSYLGVNLGTQSGDEVGYIWADYEVPAGTDPQESIVLITSATEFTVASYEFANAAGHCSFTDSTFRYDSLQALHPGTTTNIHGRGQYTALTPGTYRVEITLSGNQATITAPDGRRWRSDTSADISNWAGPWATLQLYNLGDGLTHRELKILRWGAELKRRARRGPYAASHDVGVATTQPGRLLGAMQTSGTNTATAITTSLSAKLYGLTIPIPPSRRILVEGAAWFDETVPVAPASQILGIGVYAGGVTAYGKLTTIISGNTSANNTVDAAAFANRQGTMTVYSRGRLIPFWLILDIDPTFTVGDLIEFQVKAQAGASSQVTFIDSGSATGSFSTLRRSSMKITELPPA